MKYIVVSMASILLVSVAPSTLANHAFNATYDGVNEAGCALHYNAAYLSGNFDAQFWSFELNAICPLGVFQDFCTGFGSIEIGFTNVGCSFGSTWSVSGVGHFHACCTDPAADTHVVGMTYQGSPGAGVVVATQ